MWDRLLIDCNIATMDPAVPGPFGAIENGAIGIQDGRIVRVGKRTELAGYQARKVEPLHGAWVTPGLVDCHTHLVFGGNRASEFEQRLEGATYEEIAAAGGGIVSTVKATRAATLDELVEAARPRLRALMAGGVTTVEIKSGYGLDIDAELKMLRAAKALDTSETVRIETTLLALHAMPPEFRERREEFVALAIDGLLPAAAAQDLASTVDAFCEGIGFTPAEVEALFQATRHHGLKIKLHAEQLSNLGGAALAARYGSLSADHLEYIDEAGVIAMAEAGTTAVLLPGAFYALRETRLPPVQALREAGVPMAVATDLNPGTSPMPSLRLAMNMACTLFRLTPAEALRGACTNAARALGLDRERGRLLPGQRADLLHWPVSDPAELLYWIGPHPQPRRILAGPAPG